MIYISQLIYIKPGEESTFNEFESVAIPIIARYNGKLLLRIRLGSESIIDANMELPYELHLVEFQSDVDFGNFMADEERKQYLHLKERSIEKVILIKGKMI